MLILNLSFALSNITMLTNFFDLPPFSNSRSRSSFCQSERHTCCKCKTQSDIKCLERYHKPVGRCCRGRFCVVRRDCLLDGGLRRSHTEDGGVLRCRGRHHKNRDHISRWSGVRLGGVKTLLDRCGHRPYRGQPFEWHFSKSTILGEHRSTESSSVRSSKRVSKKKCSSNCFEKFVNFNQILLSLSTVVSIDLSISLRKVSVVHFNMDYGLWLG